MKLTELEKQVAVGLFCSVQELLCAFFNSVRNKKGQQRWRAHHGAFNHICDLGTKLDLMAGGFAEIKTVSMPPVVYR